MELYGYTGNESIVTMRSPIYVAGAWEREVWGLAAHRWFWGNYRVRNLR